MVGNKCRVNIFDIFAHKSDCNFKHLYYCPIHIFYDEFQHVIDWYALRNRVTTKHILIISAFRESEQLPEKGILVKNS